MKKAWKPPTAGIMTIIAGGMGIGVGAYINVFSEVIGELAGVSELVELGELIGFLATFGWAVIGLGIVALIGGIFALKKKLWGLALAGAICATPMIPVGTTLGILSIVFLAKGKKEFV